MRDLAKDGMTMLVVTHEMQFAREVGDQLVFMDEGRIVEEGKPADVLDRPKEERTRRFLRRTLSAGRVPRGALSHRGRRSGMKRLVGATLLAAVAPSLALAAAALASTSSKGGRDSGAAAKAAKLPALPGT